MEYFDFNQGNDFRMQDEVYNALVSSDPAGSLLALDDASLQVPGDEYTMPEIEPFPDQLQDSTMTGAWDECLLEGNQPNETNAWPAKYYKPEAACEYCRERQLECFVFYDQGKNDCTCCTALFRKCSFTISPACDHGHNGFCLDTLHLVPEDVCQEQGYLTGVKRLHGFKAPKSANTQNAEPNARKEGLRFSRPAVRKLKAWLATHSHHPYPTAEEKDELKKQTGLKRSQISNWLANARRRNKVQKKENPSDFQLRSESLMGALETAYPPIDIEQAVNLQDMNPLDRWKNSPPEHEAASVSAIANAVATTPYSPETHPSSHSSSWAEHGRDSSAASSWSVYRVPSMSSLESARSSGSDMSFGSLFSYTSRNSIGSRRRRRRPALPHKGISREKLNEPQTKRMYQCTFCSDTFKTKHDWQRHEKSLHLSLEKWTCAPLGGLISMPSGRICVYCNAVNPDAEHLETHNHQACQEKSITERTFYRKDHLRQHLRLVHGCKFDVSMESWKSARLEVKSRCGFCREEFTTWQCRVDHLAGHYKGGAQMADWQGDWGFEPHIQAQLENSMTIPLIGIVQTTATATAVNPLKKPTLKWQRSTALSTPSNGEGRMLEQGGCLQRLTNGLATYVRSQLAQGIVPSDTELQKQGRLIIFFNDDMWNQTAADNPDWLHWFKNANGLVGNDAKTLPCAPSSSVTAITTAALPGDAYLNGSCDDFVPEPLLLSDGVGARGEAVGESLGKQSYLMMRGFGTIPQQQQPFDIATQDWKTWRRNRGGGGSRGGEEERKIRELWSHMQLQ